MQFVFRLQLQINNELGNNGCKKLFLDFKQLLHSI